MITEGWIVEFAFGSKRVVDVAGFATLEGRS